MTTRKHRKQQQEEYYQKLKLEVLNHYSNGTMRCAFCGVSDTRVLSIDHVDSNGTQHRKQVGHGVAFYRWLRREGFPDGFQVLCMNCQYIKRHNRRECDRGAEDLETVPLTFYADSCVSIRGDGVEEKSVN